MITNKRELSIEISKLNQIITKSAKLEQYKTDTKTAVDFLFFVQKTEGFLNKRVADLGSGNGALGIGAYLLGAKSVDFYDIDENSVETCKRNMSIFNVKGKAENLDIFDIKEKYDVVISNPPFGIRTRFDIASFIKKSREISKSLFFIYPDNTKIRSIAKLENLQIEPLGKISIPPFLKEHRKEIFKVPVVIVYV